MPATYQIDYLEFPSTDGLKTRRFFEEAFEWSFISYGPNYHAIEAAGIDAGIQGDADAATAAPLAVIRTTDLEAAQRAVELAGGVVVASTLRFSRRTALSFSRAGRQRDGGLGLGALSAPIRVVPATVDPGGETPTL